MKGKEGRRVRKGGRGVGRVRKRRRVGGRERGGMDRGGWERGREGGGRKGRGRGWKRSQKQEIACYHK